MTKRVTEYRTIAKQIYAAAEKGQGDLPERLNAEFQEKVASLENETADSIAQRIADLKGELELSQQINPSVVKKYEDLRASVRILLLKPP